MDINIGHSGDYALKNLMESHPQLQSGWEYWRLQLQEGQPFSLQSQIRFFSLLCSGADGSTITGKSQMLRIDRSLADGTVQELLLIETGNKEKRIFRFRVPAFQKREKPESCAGRITGSLGSGPKTE